MYDVNTKPFSPGCILNQPNAGLGAKEETYLPTLCSEMFQIKPYADKPSAFGLSVTLSAIKGLESGMRKDTRKATESLILSSFAALRDG